MKYATTRAGESESWCNTEAVELGGGMGGRVWRDAEREEEGIGPRWRRGAC